VGLLARAIDRGLGIGAGDMSTPIGVGYAAYGQIERGASLAGLPVTTESALRTAAAWACVRLISESIAMLPLQVFRRQSDGGRTADVTHPLYELLHDAPNATAMTAMQFRKMLTTHMLLRGNGYALIQAGPRGFVDQLLPLVPEQVLVQRNPDWTLTYRVYDPRTQKTQPYQEDEIFHVAGLSLDGMTGLSVLTYAANTLGLAQGADAYASRFFSHDARPVGALKSEKELSEAAQKRLRESWQEIYGRGVANSGSIAVLEDGLDYVPLSFNATDSQLLETRQFSVSEIARLFNVPLHMIQMESKDTSWGSGIEQLSIGFVTWALLPWLKRWEQAINRRLILAPQTYYAEHELAMVLRGDQKTRFDAYQSARMAGWLSVNEIRRLENLNGIGPEGDVYLQPSNMTDAADPQPAQPAPFPAQQDRAAQLALVARATAERAMRKEQAAVARIERRYAGDPEGLRRALDGFYPQHAAWVAGALGLSEPTAAAWADARRREVGTHGVEAFEGDRYATALDALTAEAIPMPVTNGRMQ
jgi:HK97 family phage portal protein